MKNKLNTTLDHLQEEAAEIIKVVSKIKRFGLDSKNPKTELSNLQEFRNELTDFYAVLEILKRDFGLYVAKEQVSLSEAIKKKDKAINEESMTSITNFDTFLNTFIELVQASRMVALEDNSDANPQAVELRAALKKSEKIIEDINRDMILFGDIDFLDPRVQAVYNLLISQYMPDKLNEEHWEGYMARKIVQELFNFEKLNKQCTTNQPSIDL